MAKTGVKCQHISNNAPTNLAGPDEDARKAGVEIAKKWLEVRGARRQVDAHELDVRARPGIRPNAIPRGPATAIPRNVDIVPMLKAAIESTRRWPTTAATSASR